MLLRHADVRRRRDPIFVYVVILEPIKISLLARYVLVVNTNVTTTKREEKVHKQHEMYMPNAKTQRRGPTQPIFHWKWGLHLLPNAKKSTQKKRNVHGRREKLASPNARDTNMLVYFALGNAKCWRRGHCPTPAPNARYFAFWWNIGLKLPNDTKIFIKGQNISLLKSHLNVKFYIKKI